MSGAERFFALASNAGSRQSARVAALTQTEFQATTTGEMGELAADDAPQVPIPEYRASIDAGDLDGFVFTSWPTMMRETPDGRFTHVLYGSEDKNVFLVVVVDRTRSKILGHHVLNLNDLYGVND